ncbi:hypothetical protein Golax_012171 [Gossypium laxum]|uniref:RNase H type-1 domain-containing protein n=1 Tax=Gossypium laxum TaxID=34288 RepID=A0A7J8ZMS6_9ROSI|nr:hypothetical protein [Gossypium laxum]
MMGFRRLIVEGDSLTVIKSIKKKGEDKSDLRVITHYICKMEGRRRKVCGGWVNGVLESVIIVAMKDRLA